MYRMCFKRFNFKSILLKTVSGFTRVHSTLKKKARYAEFAQRALIG